MELCRARRRGNDVSMVARTGRFECCVWCGVFSAAMDVSLLSQASRDVCLMEREKRAKLAQTVALASRANLIRLER